MKIRKSTIIATAALMAFTSCDKKKEVVAPKAAETSLAVEAILASEQNVIDTIVSSAPIEAVNDVMLVSRSQGTINSALLKLGQTVHKGAVVLSVDNAVQKAAVAQAQVAVSQAQLSYSVAKELFDKGNGSKAELMGAQTGVAAAQSGLAMAKLNLDYTKTLSTISGVVTSVEPAIKPGGSVAPGTPIGRVVDISALKQIIFVGEDQIGKVAVGDRAEINVGSAGAILDGKITAVAAAANQGSGSFSVEISASNTSDRLVKVGMGGIASIVTKKGSTGILIPSQIITERSGKKLLWVNRSGKSVLAPISARVISGGKSLITSGVEVGDTIITTGLSQLTENGLIKVTVASKSTAGADK